jgi:hypothetical protein
LRAGIEKENEMNEIVKSNNVIQSMEDVERAARAMSASKFFPDSKDAAQAIVKILAGRELGFGAFASMAGVAVIQGKPVVGANLTAAAIKQTGKYNYRVTQHTDQICEIEFFEQGQSVGKSSFSMEDAKAAGLTTKDNWKKYPRNMLFARAISNGQKWYAPDVYNGVTVYTPDEMGAIVDEEGNAVEGVVTSSEVHKQTIRERYAELFNEAVSLGVADTAWEVSEKMTDEEIKSLGIDLRAKVEAKKAGK